MKRERPLAAVTLAIATVAFFAVEWTRARLAAPLIEDWVRANVGGVQFAPEQYRVALPRLVRFLPLAAPLSVALIETLALGVTLFMLLHLARRSAHRTVAFFAATALPCLWLFSYARPETLPTSLYVVAMVALVSRRAWWAVAIALTAAQSFVRADVAVVMGAAFVASRTRPALGVACMAIGSGVQLYLQLVVYPNAVYPRGVPRIQLLANLTRPTSLASLAIVAAPLVVTALVQRRVRAELDPEDRVAIWAAALYAPLWLSFGSLREARVFVPFSFALVPTLTKVWSEATKSEHGRTH